jgi:hypothetical protein
MARMAVIFKIIRIFLPDRFVSMSEIVFMV